MEKTIRDELTLLEKLSNTDHEDKSVWTLMDILRENYRWFPEPEGTIHKKDL